MKLTGAKIIIETLKREGVDTIFGIPGGVVLTLYDEIFKQSSIKHILARHEQAAVHAAEGYAKSTGKVGVAVVTSGPGATNATTGIADAYMDSVPVVVFTGQVPTFFIGNDAFQEADATGITRSITKFNTIVKKTQELENIIRQAFYIVSSGRPNPAVIDIPKDVISGEAEFPSKEHFGLKGYKPHTEGNEKQIQRAVELLLSASKPVVYAGGGVLSANASEELKSIVTLLNLPCTLTLMGLGAYPGDDEEHFLGMLGMHGTYTANMTINNSDVILAVGARFDDRVTGKIEHFAPGAKIIHIDIDPSSISKNVEVDIPIVGDAKKVLNKILSILSEVPYQELERFKDRCKNWWKTIRYWQSKYPLTYKKSKTKIKPQQVIETLYELTKNEKVIVTTDVGQHQMWAAQFYKVKEPRTFLTSGGLGTMGSGFPFAIGAKVGKPERLVINIAGDGSFQMNMQELATAVENKLGIKIIIMKNGLHGMVGQWQRIFYGSRYSASKFEVQANYKALAESFGAIGFRVKSPSNLEKTLKKAIFDVPSDKPVVVEVSVDPLENVYPMIPPGSPPTEMILS